jgi:chaperonin GroEL
VSSHQPKRIVLGDDARQALLRGVNQLAAAVGATLGPRGRNSIIEQHYGMAYPLSTRDGVKVAESISLADPLENLGAQMVRQVASKTSKVAGDGTTTATVLAQAIFREGVKAVTAGANPMSLKRGIDAAVTCIVGTRNDAGEFEGGTLAKFSKPVSGEMIAQVGTISANQDAAIGGTIAEAMARVGKNGVVTVEESQSLETQLDVVEGMQFDRGYLSPYFVTNAERMEASLMQNGDTPVYILLYEKALAYHTDLEDIAGAVKRVGGSLLVVADDVSGGALAFMVVNKMQGMFQSIAVKAPGHGDRKKAIMEDLAILTGATVITPELGIKAESITLEMLGTAKRVTVTKDDTTIVGGGGQAEMLEARKNELKAEIERTTSEFDKPKLDERLAKLSGGVAVVKVGGATEAEMKEKVPLVRNAVNATRAAVAEGVLPGGGTALILAANALAGQDIGSDDPDVHAGWGIVSRACEEPLRQIARNAGKEGGEIVAEYRRKIAENKVVAPHGWNAATGEWENLISAGVLDPTRVTRTALQSAGSIAGLLLITESLVVDDLEAMKKVKDALPNQGPGMTGLGY